MTGNVDMLFWKRTKENSGVFVYNFKFIIFFVLNSMTNGKTECLSHFGFQIFATKLHNFFWVETEVGTGKAKLYLLWLKWTNFGNQPCKNFLLKDVIARQNIEIHLIGGEKSLL